MALWTCYLKVNAGNTLETKTATVTFKENNIPCTGS
jgi:hypothetical protein